MSATEKSLQKSLRHQAPQTPKSISRKERLWKIAETTYDVGRGATLPLRLLGNIALQTARKLEGDNRIENGAGGLAFALGVVGTSAIFLGLSATPVVGAAVGIGVLCDVPLAAFTLAGTVEGVSETYRKTKERTAYLRKKRAARRASWQ